MVPKEEFPPSTSLTLHVTDWSRLDGSTCAANWTVSANLMAAEAGETVTPPMTNGSLVETEPRGVVMVTGPVVAPTGTSATTVELVNVTTRPAAPLKLTPSTPAPKPTPVKVTRSP